MDGEVLLEFLAIGVIDVNGDDNKLEKLRAAVTDLVSVLKETPTKTASFTIVAADPDVPPEDPTVQVAMVLLKKHWTTVANTFSGTPVAVVRAMLLDSLVQTARQDDAIAVAFVNTARNVLPHTESGEHQAIWAAAIAEIESLVDLRAEAEWSTPETIKIDPFNFKSPAGIVVNSGEWSADRATLQTAVAGATGPFAGGNCNPHWLHQSPQAWGPEFASRLSAVLADTVEEAVAEVSIEPIDLGPSFVALAKAVGTHVETALAAFSGATAGLQRRTNLLWWKEALYSSSAKASYRDIPVFSAASLMALDLFKQVPTYSPASVAAFLSEAILQLPFDEKSDGETLFTLTVQAMDVSELEPLRHVAAELVPTVEGRRPLLSLLGHAGSSGLLDASTLRQVSGMSADSVFCPSAWGALLYRELQAARATHEAGVKRPRRKG